jgi:hypothetical protein
MSAKSIFEADGKAILNYHLTRAPVIKPTPLPASATHNPPSKLASLYFPADADVRGILDQAEATYPWLLVPGSKFVAKPDQLIKRRGKSGLLALNKTWAEAKEWIAERAGKPQRVETVDGVLRQFLVEPFVPHPQDTEYYININSVREVCTLPSFSACASFKSCLSGIPPGLSARVLGAFWHARHKVAARRKRLVGPKHTGAMSVLFEGRPDEGKLADPLLQSTYISAIRTSTFTCQIIILPCMLQRYLRLVNFLGRGVAALLCCASAIAPIMPRSDLTANVPA